MLKQILIILLGALAFAINVIIAKDPIRKNDTAAHDLKEAGKQLVIETPVKTGYALKNTAQKAYEVTKEGAQKAYDMVVVTPAHAIKDAAQNAANSQVVKNVTQKTQEAAQAIKEAGLKAYHVCIERPAHAINDTLHSMSHHHHHHHHVHENNPERVTLRNELVKANQNIYVAVIEIPDAHLHEDPDSHPHSAKGIIIMPEEIAKQTSITIKPHPSEHQGLHLYVEPPLALSPASDALDTQELTLLAKAYNGIQDS